jgi:hypothetical protein
MSILVVCPGCRKRFQVSEKFAGQSGPCPQCKATIQIPEKSEEVKVHAPTEFASGGRTIEGKLALKPVSRKVARFDPLRAAAIGGACLAVVVVAFALGRAGIWERSLLFRALGTLAVSPLLVLAAYPFLRDPELGAYHGKELYVRAGLCALVYAILWGAFGYLAGAYMTGELWEWLVVAPPLVLLGALAAHASLDLEFGNAVLHYAFYVLVTVILRWIGGMGGIWEVGAGA